MARTRYNQKARRDGSSFSQLPHVYFQSEQYAALSARAVKLLIDLYCQYRGKNNGDLTASWVVMKKRGWTSKSQLQKGLKELESRGWILKTRQGSIHKASLYAVTFQGIDYCSGKLDSGVMPDARPLLLWKFPGFDTPRAQSGRHIQRASARRPDLDTGQSAPQGGASVIGLRRHLPLVGGQS